MQPFVVPFLVCTLVVPEQEVSGADLRTFGELVHAYHHRIVAEPGGHQAISRSQRWATTFDGSGFSVVPYGEPWTWGLELEAFAVDGVPVKLSCAESTSREQRLTYEWSDDLSEWYVNDARGLEHGFIVHRELGDTLTLTLSVRGELSPRVDVDGRDVGFTDAQGIERIRYDKLQAFDADGVPLVAGFEAIGQSLVLTVDATGATYPLLIDPLAQQAYLKAPNSETMDNFGFSVGISGDRVVVGAPDEDSAGTGTLSGVGSPNMNDNSASFAGAAYVFLRTSSGWVFEDYLKASNTDAFDNFGYAVAIDGDTIAVGASNEDSAVAGIDGDPTSNASNNTGAVYIFRRIGAAWIQEAYIKPDVIGLGDQFGRALGLDADTLVVAAATEDGSSSGVDGDPLDNGTTSSGAAYVFRRTAGVWAQEAYLKSSAPGPFDRFGYSVAVQGDRVVIGSDQEDSAGTGTSDDLSAPSPFNDDAPNSGAAFVYSRTGSTWSFEAYLKASNTDAEDWFGRDVAIYGDTIFVGAMGEDSNSPSNPSDNSTMDSGAAYVFEKGPSGWTQTDFLKHPDPSPLDHFGRSVSVFDRYALVSAPHEDSGASGVDGDLSAPPILSSGAVVFLLRYGGVWQMSAFLKASTPDVLDLFGASTDLSDDGVAVIGANYESSGSNDVDGDEADDSANLAGAAYVIEVAPLGSVTFRNAGTNPASYFAEAPVIGETWNASVNLTTTGHGVAALIGYSAPIEFPLAGGQTLLVFGTADLFSFPLGLAPVANFSLDLPPEASLCGATVYSQAIHLGVVSPFALSNAQDLVVGF